MTNSELTNLTVIGTLETLKKRVTDAAALAEINRMLQERKAFKPSLSKLVSDWTETLNNVSGTILAGLLDTDNVLETTVPVIGDRVEWDGVTPNLTGTVTDYSPESDSYKVEADNGEVVRIDADRVGLERWTDKYNAFGEYPDGARNFWELPEKDREWARNNRHMISAIGFRIYEWNGGGGDGFTIIVYEHSDENDAMEQLYKARFGWTGTK